MPRTSEPGRSVSSRLLQVLFSFSRSRDGLSLADLVRETGLPHATVRRLVLELAQAGAVDRQPDGRYAVGIKLWRLGTMAPRTESLRAVALPFMEDLYTALRQHVQLAVMEGREAVIIERLSSPKALGLVSRVGGRLPLHCSGVGKVLLAHSETALVDEILEGRLTAFTTSTTVDPAVLRRELAECRRSGYATVHGELSENADSYATRILDSGGYVVAALSVVVRSESVKQNAVVPALVASGLHISRLLGWQPGIRVRRP
jgi:DNA-binding IclR family transcriptional regulator